MGKFLVNLICGGSSENEHENNWFGDPFMNWKDMTISHIINKLFQLPLIVWDFIVEQATTTMLVDSDHQGYGCVLAFLSQTARASKFLHKVTLPANPSHHYFQPSVASPKFNFSLGYGRTWFTYSGKLMFVDHYRNSPENEEVMIGVFGRNVAVLEKLLAEACQGAFKKVVAEKTNTASKATNTKLSRKPAAKKEVKRA